MSGAWSSYLHELNAPRAPGVWPPAPPPLHELRLEELERPTVAELIPPGTLVRTSYRTHLVVDRVTPHTYYGVARAWTVTGYSCGPDGIADRRESRRGWLNEIVIEWDGDRPTFAKLFRANTDTLEIVGAGMTQDRRGQLSLI